LLIAAGLLPSGSVAVGVMGLCIQVGWASFYIMIYLKYVLSHKGFKRMAAGTKFTYVWQLACCQLAV
jgi:hypothetical protein